MALGTGSLGDGADGRAQAAMETAARPAAWRVRNVSRGTRASRDIA
jgi:hypothetical protein